MRSDTEPFSALLSSRPTTHCPSRPRCTPPTAARGTRPDSRTRVHRSASSGPLLLKDRLRIPEPLPDTLSGAGSSLPPVDPARTQPGRALRENISRSGPALHDSTRS
jgi:hypothetical protein